MTITEFVERAIEGGWENRESYRWENTESRDPNKVYCFSHVLLDPEAWKAVGRVEGWTEPEFYGTKPTRAYLARMHRMIDALAEGRSVEQYLETLTNPRHA